VTVSWRAAKDHGAPANDGSGAQPRVVVLQRELLPNLSLMTSIARTGIDVIGLFNKVSQARNWMENDRPDAAVLDIALWDGISFDLASELLRRKIPFLFYTSWNDTELIPIELREMPFLEKPIHLVLVASLLSKMIKRGQVLEGQEAEDADWSSISDPPPARG
jgi:two-component SAPR family response regulator